MGLWKVIEPNPETINECANPSLEKALTGWTAADSASLARSTEFQTKGAYSLAVTPGGGTGSGVYYGTLTLSPATVYYLSFSFRAAPGVPYTAYLYDVTAAGQIGAAISWTGDTAGRWRRIAFSVTTHATNTAYRLYIVKNGSVSITPIYIDAVLVTTAANCTYLDGDAPACRWLGTPHLSRSLRLADTAYGGVVKDLTDDFSLMVDQSIDTGLAPVEVVNQMLAQGIGSIFQDIQIKARVWQLVSHLVGVAAGDNDPRTMYHALRHNLVKLLGPAKIDRTNPVQIGYELNGKLVWIGGFYTGGLEKGNLANTHAEISAPLRFVSPNPLWQGEMGVGHLDRGGGPGNGQGATALEFSESVSGVGYIIRRKADGSWDNMDGGVADAPLGMDEFEGSLYVARFGASGGRVEIFDLSANNWGTLPDPSAGNFIYTVRVRANGDVVIGSGSSPYCRRYNGTSWSTVGSGLNGNVRALLFGNDGLMYATGSFSTAGGGTVNRMAYINLSSGNWQAMDGGAAGWDGGLALAKDSVGNIYIGGQPSSPPDECVYKWDPVAGTLTALGLVGPDSINALVFGPDGSLYAAGNGGGSSPALYRYNGFNWEDISTGLSGANIDRLAFDDQGVLYIPNISAVGGVALTNGVAMYNGNLTFPYPLDLPGFTSALAAISDGSLIFGILSSGSAIVPAVNTLTNLGSADTGPIIRVTGPGRLYSLFNKVGGQLFGIYLDLALIADEEAIIDLRLDQKTISTNLRGDVTAVAVLDGSDFEEFVLQPGQNRLQAFFASSVTEAVVYWPELHLSVDGVAAGD